MAYNLSVKSIQKVKSYLEAMVVSTASLHWKVPDARKLAYQIHEAFESAKSLKIERYAKLRDSWKIKYKGTNVTAELLDAPPIMPGSLRFDNLTDPLDIVQKVIEHKLVNFDLLFPDVHELDDMVKDWCRVNGYDCILTESGLLIGTIKIEEPDGSTQPD